jgi:hypothetical protein
MQRVTSNSPVLVEQAGGVLLLRLCPVARQELTQEALPGGGTLTPQVPENLRGLLFRLQNRTGQDRTGQDRTGHGSERSGKSKR